MAAISTIPTTSSMRVAEHPELDQPEGELSWQQWLEGRQRLETALLLSAG